MSRKTRSSVPSFDLSIIDSGMASDTWVDLGLLPTGKQYRLGAISFSSIDKTLTFDLRSNNTGLSAADDAESTSLVAVRVRGGSTVDKSFTKGKTSLILTATGTGVEHWWLHIHGKGGQAGEYFYKIYYTEY